ncbi:MAG: hypothetical protein KDC46_11680 [Thermoleophilia bacterium]|nr:hypothetical protein [Thermoleophilia bacterium]
MQLTTAATAAGPRDKASWPTIAALPTDLPAPAHESAARFDLWAKFSAGSYADSRAGYAVRVSPTWDFETGDPARTAVRYVGRDPRAALAAASARAGHKHLQPMTQDGKRHYVDTLVGLYRSGSSWFTVPVWYTPGTNDWQHFGDLGNSFARTPDARFTFRDDRLAAVVGIDGYIANPKHAAAFAH